MVVVYAALTNVTYFLGGILHRYDLLIADSQDILGVGNGVFFLLKQQVIRDGHLHEVEHKSVARGCGGVAENVETFVQSGRFDSIGVETPTRLVRQVFRVEHLVD